MGRPFGRPFNKSWMPRGKSGHEARRRIGRWRNPEWGCPDSDFKQPLRAGVRILAARSARAVLESFATLKRGRRRPSKRGRRESRVPAAPIAPCAKGSKHTVVDHRFTETPGVSCAMVLTVYIVLSPVTGFLVTVAPKKLASRELDASIGASGPHGFAVCAHAVRRAARSHPPHPIPRK